MVLDAAIMIVGGNLLAAQGAALVDTAMQGLLGAVAGWLGPDTTLYMANSFAGSHAAVADGSAAIAVIGGADGPTAIFVTSAYDAQAMWGLAVMLVLHERFPKADFVLFSDLAELCVQQAHYL